MIIYDIEIIRAIPDRNGQKLPGIQYCDGWHDHANMGVSVACAYDYETGRYRVFCGDNIGDLVERAHDSPPLVGFNSLSFDDKVLKANGWLVETGYDILVEVWRAAGLGPTFSPGTHGGYGLDALAKANGFGGKTGNGALAPVQWQRGEIGVVIDYCLEDVRQTKQVLDRVLSRGWLVSPKESGKKLQLRRP